MARDNSPKERQRKQLERKLGRRADYDRILIVSEGSKTEPNYLKEIQRHYRLHTANVAVHPGELGTSPKQVVQYALDLFQKGDPKKQIQPRAFEQVYAVFDRDDHANYVEALQLASAINERKITNDLKQKLIFKAIASVPSFELWLLLHFEDVQAPMHRDETLRRLKVHVQGYEKGNRNVFATTKAHLEIAKSRAQMLATKFNAHTDPEPFTAMHEVVETLIKLRC
jgi:hypothetical protein